MPKRTEARRRRDAFRLEQGLCRICAKPVGPKRSRVLCDYHQELQNQVATRYREKRTAPKESLTPRERHPECTCPDSRNPRDSGHADTCAIGARWYLPWPKFMREHLKRCRPVTDQEEQQISGIHRSRVRLKQLPAHYAKRIA
jgi:hypothetical protein